MTAVSEGELNRLAAMVHQNAVDHGWWEKDMTVEVPTKLLLIHAEISEATEEYRERGAEGIKVDYAREDGKPEGFGVELADAVIRILDLAAALGLDIDMALRMKHEYNKSRPYRHGGKHA